ncbi:proline-specific peptidase [Trametes punicea]|nr:proline-specific peptidase [Trametes punicea]
MATSTVSVKEGHIDFPYQGEIHQTYYKIFGDLENRMRAPVVVLHGGPGLSHDYLLPLSDLAKHSLPIIFYDQVGNARSTHLPEKPPTFWTIDFFLDELENLLKHFEIQDNYLIVGHSWGGMLASEFVVRRHPPGLRKLVISNAPPSVALWSRSFKELLAKFPPDVQDAIAKGLADPERYWNALMKFYDVHGCRVKPFPKELKFSLLQNNGPNSDRSVAISPILDGWTVIDRLHSFDVSTLVMNGHYDIAQDYVTRPWSDNIPNSKWITFENSSHTPFWEEREKYMQVVHEFLEAEA